MKLDLPTVSIRDPGTETETKTNTETETETKAEAQSPKPERRDYRYESIAPGD